MSLTSDIQTSSDYKAWIEKIQSELKGKELSNYDYVWDGVHISPFEAPNPVRRVLSRKENNEWHHGCAVRVNIPDPNNELLSVLELGATALSIDIDSILSWGKVFQQIHLDWIQSEFVVHDVKSWENLSAYLSSYPSGKVSGICWVNENLQLEFFEKYQPMLPEFRFLTIQLKASNSADEIAGSLKKLLNRISIISAHCESKKILDHIAIKFEGGEDLVLNISMIRALRLLWMQSLKSAGLDAYAHEILISATVPFIKPVPTDQMIASSLIATSLVLGGTDSLFIADPDQMKPDARWGLMAQHILSEEARLHISNDPLSGSHVIERLTGVIAKKVWEQMEKK
ncbi:MAG: methylmalonyl-CoA mutase family protein [Saprospiraceae bacterium]